MKDIIKKVIITILAISLLIICIPSQTMAANPKGSIYNPVKLGTGGKCKVTWERENKEFYVTFKMKKQGYATISTTKIYGSTGKIIGYDYFLYDSKGNLVWDCLTSGQENIPKANNINKVGLKKGAYTLKIDPSLYSSDYGETTTISVKTTANAYWEVENNDSFAKATALKLNKKYYAVYGDNSHNKSDHFKVKLTEGQKYRIQIGNYDGLFSDTALCNVYDPSKAEIKIYDGYQRAGSMIKQNGGATIKASKSGYYYIKIWNQSGFRTPGSQYAITVKTQ